MRHQPGGEEYLARYSRRRVLGFAGKAMVAGVAAIVSLPASAAWAAQPQPQTSPGTNHPGNSTAGGQRSQPKAPTNGAQPTSTLQACLDRCQAAYQSCFGSTDGSNTCGWQLAQCNRNCQEGLF